MTASAQDLVIIRYKECGEASLTFPPLLLVRTEGEGEWGGEREGGEGGGGGGGGSSGKDEGGGGEGGGRREGGEGGKRMESKEFKWSTDSSYPPAIADLLTLAMASRSKVTAKGQRGSLPA